MSRRAELKKVFRSDAGPAGKQTMKVRVALSPGPRQGVKIGLFLVMGIQIPDRFFNAVIVAHAPSVRKSPKHHHPILAVSE